MGGSPRRRHPVGFPVSDEFDRAWERDRWQRRSADPAYRQHERERKRLARRAAGANRAPRNSFEREAAKEARAATRQAAARARIDGRQFVGVDGEGIRTGNGGHAVYALLRAGGKELYRGGRRLLTPECLLFLLQALPPSSIAVGFAFDYDASNILFDVAGIPAPNLTTPSRFERLFLRESNAWTWLNFDGWPEFGVHYRPRNHLKICLAAIDPKTKRRHARPGTVRTIFDTWGFFQGTFLNALDKWGVGQDETTRAIIERHKATRSDFREITTEIRDYNALECDLLADLMNKFRDTCLTLDMRPKTWNGAGKLASAVLDMHKTITRKEIEALCPGAVLDQATAAYYGGRFETTRAGWVGGRRGGGPVWEHDISSAYPAAMTQLPCLRHGKFRRAKPHELAGLLEDDEDRTLFICPVVFSHPREAFLCGLPFREKGGALAWPRAGQGTYWSVELRSARRLGAQITCRDGFIFEPGQCDCRPYDWIVDLFERRRKLGKSTKGYAIRLALNALYGKHAQRVGLPKYANAIIAGLITAITRAKINDAILAAGPENVVMIATDAIYTVGRKAPLDFGPGLGQWEAKRFSRMFIVRPGLYWPSKPRGKAANEWKLKTKGISQKFFEPAVPTFQRAWAAYCRRTVDPALQLSPVVTLTIPMFVGLRYAHSIGRPDLACQWIEHPVEVRFGDRGEMGAAKRGGAAWSVDRRGLILGSKPGDPRKVSLPYRRGAAATWGRAWELQRELIEAMPDALDMGAPFRIPEASGLVDETAPAVVDLTPPPARD